MYVPARAWSRSPRWCFLPPRRRGSWPSPTWCFLTRGPSESEFWSEKLIRAEAITRSPAPTILIRAPPVSSCSYESLYSQHIAQQRSTWELSGVWTNANASERRNLKRRVRLLNRRECLLGNVYIKGVICDRIGVGENAPDKCPRVTYYYNRSVYSCFPCVVLCQNVCKYSASLVFDPALWMLHTGSTSIDLVFLEKGWK